MKLNFLFIVMDLLTLVAYPVVFVHGKLLQLYKAKENIRVPNVLISVPIRPGR